jgi:hypothetical protein
LPEGCYLLELNHTRAIWAPVIFCRQGGEFTTSDEEAMICPRRGCSKPLPCEVIRSPQEGGGPRQRIFVGRGLPSSWPLLLGGDAWRTPAIGGGGAQGPDRVSSFCLRVLVVISGGPFYNLWFLCAIDAIGPPCKLYLPRVI